MLPRRAQDDTGYDELRLTVARDSVLAGAVGHVVGLPRAHFALPLHVTFLAEPAMDAGGPTREFFQLAMRGAFHPDVGMFRELPESRRMWFADTVGVDLYQPIGVLLGLALRHGVTTGLQLPRALYVQLSAACRKAVGGGGAAGAADATAEAYPAGELMRDLAECDPALASGLQRLLECGETALAAMDLTWSVDTPGGGTVPLVPGGAARPVTVGDCGAFVAAYARWWLVDAVAAPFADLARGFIIAAEEGPLAWLSPGDLEAALAGHPVSPARRCMCSGGILCFDWFWLLCVLLWQSPLLRDECYDFIAS